MELPWINICKKLAVKLHWLSASLIHGEIISLEAESEVGKGIYAFILEQQLV